MIQVTVLVDPKQQNCGILISGHAGYKEPDRYQRGQELVCAAVSALALNMANSVEHFTDTPFLAEVEEDSGMFRFQFTQEADAEAALLMNSLIFGLLDIQEEYGEPYINICYKEV